MKRNKFLLAILFAVMTIVSTFASTFVSNVYAENLDKIAAIVNSDVITESEVQKKLTMLKQQLAASHTPMPSSAEMRSQILDKLIDKTIELQLAKKSEITVDAAAVDKAIADIAKRNNATLDQMKAELQREGMSYKDFRKQIEEGMIINKLQQAAVGHNITVTDQEAKDYLAKMLKAQPKMPDFKQYHVIDMMVHVPDDATQSQKDAAKAKAVDILSKLQGGADFSSFADTDKSLTVEDLGWRRFSDLPELFANQVRRMEEGDVAGVIQAPNGLHLIELREIHEMKPPPGSLPPSLPVPTLADAKDMVYRHKIEEKADKWVKNMRVTAYVKIINNE